MSDPICGACGRPKSEHVWNGGHTILHCHQSGQRAFMDIPSDTVLLEMIKKKHPRIVDAILSDWRFRNGYPKKVKS